MKTKKNAGFSLVELIVVIAIMAVLVGVLAPAYLKYVEKSRKSTDVDAFSTIMSSAETVSSDNEYATKGVQFVITSTGTGTATLTTGLDTTLAGSSATSVNATVLTDWVAASNINDKTNNAYTFKSKTFKADSGVFTGTIQDTGAVVWKDGGTGTLYSDMTTFSTSFAGKFES
jgi:type IV pilus assembly protein PilA